MKLFEDLAKMGGTIRDAVQKIIKDVYKQEPDDSKLDEIVNSLSLSDLLELDRAYTAKDAERIKSVLGPMPQMEYSMGGGRQATSQASNRPAPTQPQGQKAKVEPGTQNTVQTNRNYSSGAQNAVTSKKVDVNNPGNPNDPNASQLDPNTGEPIEEASNSYLPPKAAKALLNQHGLYYSGDKKGFASEFSSTDGRAYWLNYQEGKWSNEKGEEGTFMDGSLEKSLSTVAEDAPSPAPAKAAPGHHPAKSAAPAQGQPPAQKLPLKTAQPEPPGQPEQTAAPADQTDAHPEAGDTASVSDVSFYPDEQPSVATPEEEGRSAEDINVVDMVKWLKRRAGNDK